MPFEEVPVLSNNCANSEKTLGVYPLVVGGSPQTENIIVTKRKIKKNEKV